ncbi:MAG: hypothetical protein ACRD2A_05255 [Vicinamibacterales bacterium]
MDNSNKTVNAEDAARELDKCVTTLERVEDYLLRMNEMNAQLHLAEKVLPSPLTVLVQTTERGATQAARRFREA